MRITDCHMHIRGAAASPADVLKGMDKNGVSRIILLSESERTSLDRTREKLLATKKLADAAPDRITALARLEPTIPGMNELVKEVLGEMGFAGIKIIPDHWYAHDKRLQAWWQTLNDLGARVLFHTGILYAFEDGSRFTRPLYLEALLNYPKIRFAMAHISWPWCDECLAVMGRLRAAAGYKNDGWQSYIDITPGPPEYIRKQALANAISFCGAERIMFGSDDCAPVSGYGKYAEFEGQRKALESYMRIFDELELTQAQRERIMSGTADELFPPRRS